MTKKALTVCAAMVCVMVMVGNHTVIAEEEAPSISGWLRTDTDGLGTQIWFGATHPLSGVDIASDIYVVGATAEFDIGPSLTVVETDANSLSVLPMVGLAFDFEALNLTTLVPQFYTYVTVGSIYFESWIQGFLSSPFDDTAFDNTDTLYTRNFALYAISDVISIGPQVELTLNLEDETAGAGAKAVKLDAVATLAIGGRINLGYGENNTLGLFVGYETKEEARGDGDGVVGRFTFIRNW